jgi:predicted aminopeptidase
LLKYDQETLANIIIHELFHSTFYLAGQTALNESLANFAGHRGTIAFFTKEDGGEVAARKAEVTWKNELTVSDFLARAAERLNALYASSASEVEKLQQREELFTRLQDEFRHLPGPVRQNTDFATVKLNNAVVLQYLVYLKELALFERIYQQNGHDLRTTLAHITAAAEKGDDPFMEVRTLAGVSTGEPTSPVTVSLVASLEGPRSSPKLLLPSPR